MRIKFIRTLLVCTALLWGSGIAAQTPTLELLSDGTTLIGIATHADGSPAAALAVQLEDQSRAQTLATSLSTDSAGLFMLQGAGDTQYTASAIINGVPVSATVRTGPAPPAPFQWPPIYITLGALMLLSLIPARLLRRKDV